MVHCAREITRKFCRSGWRPPHVNITTAPSTHESSAEISGSAAFPSSAQQTAAEAYDDAVLKVAITKARGIIGPSWFNLPFLKQRQLLPEEQIPGCQSAARPEPESDKTTQIEKHDHRSKGTVTQSGEHNQRSGHERSGSLVTRRYQLLLHSAEGVFADHRRWRWLPITGQGLVRAPRSDHPTR